MSEPATEIWRLRLSVGNGRSGTGRVSLFETRKALVAALYEAALEVESNINRRGRPQKDPTGERRRWCSLWRRHKDGMDDVDGAAADWNVEEVLAVERLVDGEWTEVRWALFPPKLQLSVDDVSPFTARVQDSGGGMVSLIVDRDTFQYPRSARP